MSDKSVRKPGEDPAREANLLVVVDADRDRELLVEWLGGIGYDVTTVAADPDAVVRVLDSGEVDLVLADARGIQRVGESVAAHRDRHRPEFVPSAVVIPEGDEERWIGAASEGEMAAVDDVITLPTRKRHLRRRIESLLRARRYSIELDKRKTQYRRLLGMAPDGILLVEDGEIVYGNQTAQEMLLGELDQRDESGSLQGREFAGFLKEPDRDQFEDLVAAVMAGKTYDGMLEVTLWPDRGEPAGVEITGVRVPYRNGFATQLVVRDVTERQQRERRLTLFSRALDEASVGVSIADVTQVDDPLVYVNPAFESITGYETGEILGENCRFLQGPGTDPDTVAKLRSAIAARESIQVTIRNYRKDGTPFWNELELTPVQNEVGAVTHYLGFQRDVTEREERKRTLQEYETIFEAAGEPIYSLDPEGNFTNVNEALCDLMSYEADELLGAHVSKVMTGEDIDRCERRIARLIERDRVSDTVEVDITTASDGRRQCEVTLALIPYDELEGFQGTVGVLRDVTQIRRRQQQLAVMDRVLRHDIRNTMNVVRGRVEMIEPDDELDREHVAEIRSVSESLLSLSEQARTFHRVFFDGPNALREVDLVEVVEGVFEEFRARTGSLQLSLEAPDRAVATVHPGIDEAVRELLANALTHTDRDHPTVTVSIVPAGEEVHVVVEDDGPGLPAGEWAAFEGDLESALKHASGLGLWLVTWVVETSGGEVDCEGVEPRGTRMILRFQSAASGERRGADGSGSS